MTNEPSVLWRLTDSDLMGKGNGQSQTLALSKKESCVFWLETKLPDLGSVAGFGVINFYGILPQNQGIHTNIVG